MVKSPSRQNIVPLATGRTASPHFLPSTSIRTWAKLSRVATFSQSLRDNVRLQVSSNKTVSHSELLQPLNSLNSFLNPTDYFFMVAQGAKRGDFIRLDQYDLTKG